MVFPPKAIRRGTTPRLQETFSLPIFAPHHVISYDGGVGRSTGVGRARGVAVGLCGGGVAVAQGVPNAWHQVMRSVSTRQPSLPAPMSLAIRQRSLLEV